MANSKGPVSLDNPDMEIWGWGVTKDLKEVVKWWRKAAKQGNAAARYDLAAVEKQLRAEGNWPPRSRQAKANPACSDLSRLPVFIIAG